MPDQQSVGDTVVIIVVLAALTIGLLSVLVGRVVAAWDRLRAWWHEGFERERQRRYVETDTDRAIAQGRRMQIIPYREWAETNNETAETPQQKAEIEAEKIAFAETAVAVALARLVLAEEIKLTEAVKIGAGKKSGEGYQKWSRLIKAAMEEQQADTTPIAERPTAAKFVSR